MSDKIARLGIERDNDKMYFIKNGDVWAVPRKQKGRPKGRPAKVAATGLEMDYSKYIYYLDGDGDVARKARALGGRKTSKPSKSAKPAKVSAMAKAVPPSSSSKRTGKKSEAQIAREVDECIAKVRGGNGSDASAPAGKTKRR